MVRRSSHARCRSGRARVACVGHSLPLPIVVFRDSLAADGAPWMAATRPGVGLRPRRCDLLALSAYRVGGVDYERQAFRPERSQMSTSPCPACGQPRRTRRYRDPESEPHPFLRAFALSVLRRPADVHDRRDAQWALAAVRVSRATPADGRVAAPCHDCRLSRLTRRWPERHGSQCRRRRWTPLAGARFVSPHPLALCRHVGGYEFLRFAPDLVELWVGSLIRLTEDELGLTPASAAVRAPGAQHLKGQVDPRSRCSEGRQTGATPPPRHGNRRHARSPTTAPATGSQPTSLGSAANRRQARSSTASSADKRQPRSGKHSINSRAPSSPITRSNSRSAKP